MPTDEPAEDASASAFQREADIQQDEIPWHHPEVQPRPSQDETFQQTPDYPTSRGNTVAQRSQDGFLCSRLPDPLSA